MRTCPVAAENLEDNLSLKMTFFSFLGTIAIFYRWGGQSQYYLGFMLNFFRILCTKNYSHPFIFDWVIREKIRGIFEARCSERLHAEWPTRRICRYICSCVARSSKGIRTLTSRSIYRAAFAMRRSCVARSSKGIRTLTSRSIYRAAFAMRRS